MSLLRAFVLLSVLLVCTLAQDPECKAPAGKVDAFQQGMCNCWSGYAPSTPDALDCKSHPKCAPNLADGDLNTLQTNAPMRPKVVFAYDSLEIVQQVPIVANRRATVIRFYVPKGLSGVAEPLRTCGYPGPLWNKTVNGRDCIDEFRASIPWGQSGPCGFAKDPSKSSNTTAVYSANIVTSVEETFKNGDESFQRTSSTSYLLSVSFEIQKTLPIESFQVSIPNPQDSGVLTKYLVSNSAYDPTTGATTLSIVTTTKWPYQINPAAAGLASAFTGVVPANPLLAVTFENLADDSLPCSTKSRSTCTQRWKATITSTGECVSDIQGTYSFTAPLLCRDNAPSADKSCPTGLTTVSFDLKVQKTDLCDSTPVDTSLANSFQLTAFSDADHATSSVQYQTGDTVYWTFDATNSVASIKSISFNTIKLGLVGSEGASDILYTKASGNTPAGNAVNLATSAATGIVQAGSKGTLTFHYDLLRAQLPSSLGQLQSSNTEVQVATSVIVDIEYYGNTKRSIEMDLSEMSAISAGRDVKAIRVVAPELMNGETATPSEQLANPSSASTLGALSFVLFALLALLF